MKEHLTRNDIANHIRMARTAHKGTIVLVEGYTDACTYKFFTDSKACMVIPAHGKENALKALKILEEQSFLGILVIVDADFQRLDGIEPWSLNLLLTDTHDLETMILAKSTALEKILLGFGSENKIKKLAKPVPTMLCCAALPIGLLRWLSSKQQESLSLNFKDLTFKNFVDEKNLTTDIDKLIEDIRSRSNNVVVEKMKALKDKVNDALGKGYDPWQACSGHDMIGILLIGLKQLFGNKDAENLTKEVLEKFLRVAFEYDDFRRTGLCFSIKQWEENNRDYKILKNTGAGETTKEN